MIADAHSHLIPPGLLSVVGEARRLFSPRPMCADAGEQGPRVLRFVIGMTGADRAMLGSDMPFSIGLPELVTIVENAGLEPDQVEAIAGGAAQKPFRIN